MTLQVYVVPPPSVRLCVWCVKSNTNGCWASLWVLFVLEPLKWWGCVQVTSILCKKKKKTTVQYFYKGLLKMCVWKGGSGYGRRSLPRMHPFVCLRVTLINRRGELYGVGFHDDGGIVNTSEGSEEGDASEDRLKQVLWEVNKFRL